jgi:transcriptional regulator with XRE-family HTH domain
MINQSKNSRLAWAPKRAHYAFMEWNSESLRNLRLRLGWSRAELARKISCESQAISNWEMGLDMIEPVFSPRLEKLFQDAELASLEIAQFALADQEMSESNLEFIGVQNQGSQANN